MVNRLLDSTVTKEQLLEFYDKNKEQYQLETPILRCRFIKALRKAPDAEKAQDFMNQIKPALDKKPNAAAALIRSAMAAATGAQEHARELARTGLKLLPESPAKSEDKQNKRLLEQILKNPVPVEAFL